MVLEHLLEGLLRKRMLLLALIFYIMDRYHYYPCYNSILHIKPD